MNSETKMISLIMIADILLIEKIRGLFAKAIFNCNCSLKFGVDIFLLGKHTEREQNMKSRSM